MEHQRCKKMDELPVVVEWQNAIYCPNCAHYSSGECCNPSRTGPDSACPFDGKKLPVKLVDATDFKYVVGQQVLVEFGEGNCCNAKIIDRKTNEFGNIYQVDWSGFFKEAKNHPWMLERFISSE